MTREDNDHGLKAWKKANRKLATSVEEWEKFGYQEQLSADNSCEKGVLVVMYCVL